MHSASFPTYAYYNRISDIIPLADLAVNSNPVDGNSLKQGCNKMLLAPALLTPGQGNERARSAREEWAGETAKI